jgi:hypothetical protein
MSLSDLLSIEADALLMTALVAPRLLRGSQIALLLAMLAAGLLAVIEVPHEAPPLVISAVATA